MIRSLHGLILLAVAGLWAIQTAQAENLQAATAAVTATREVITTKLPKLPKDVRPLRLVRIPAGTFQMGSPDTERGRIHSEGPVHTVTIAQDFYLGETEVTQAQWQAVMGYNPAVDGHTMRERYAALWGLVTCRGWQLRPLKDYGIGPQHPVYRVSWDDCQTFLVRLNQLGQGTFRLPSEAEWEYACRAGTTTRFSFGDALECDDDCGSCTASDQYMWWCGNNSPQGSKPVATKLPNAWGLFDLHGNVMEWCEDDWHGSYEGAPGDGRAWVDSPRASSRVLRGGDWSYGAWACRSANQFHVNPDYRSLSSGVRLLREAP